MRKRWIWIVATLVVFAVLVTAGLTYAAGYWPRYQPYPEVVSWEVLDEQIQSDRGESLPEVLREEQVDELLYQYTEFADTKMLEKMEAPVKNPGSLSAALTQRLFVFGDLSVEEAKEDVELLFSAFKYAYCLYEYFGGDSTFEAAKDALLKDIEELGKEGGTLSKRAFRQLVLEHLEFVQDAHVLFAGEALFRRKNYFYSDKIAFARDESGYFTVIGGDRYYLQGIDLDSEGNNSETVIAENRGGRGSEGGLSSTNSSSLDEYLKLTLDTDGRFVYILGTVSADSQRTIPVRVILHGDEEMRVDRVLLWRRPFMSFYQPVVYRRGEKDGVAIVVNRDTAPSTEEAQAELERFVLETAEIANRNVAILDLRNHSGGQPQPALQWVETLAGQPVTYDQHDAALRTRIALTLQRNFVEWYYRGNQARKEESIYNINLQLDRLRTFDPVDDVVWSIHHFEDSQPALIPNDTLLFVLIDRGTGSAGEDFVHFLRQLDNVVFVGENTKGQNLSGEPAWGSLPNSEFSFQITLDMTLTGGWEEGTGFSPDIWVNPNLALRRVLKFIEREEH